MKKTDQLAVELISEKMASMRCVSGYFSIDDKSKRPFMQRFFCLEKRVLNELIETNGVG
ncbi:hypothetical protein D931_03983 [Enterococcus faecium 13.SD.W.09]|nr:hypothetical protein D931_03983 [Enterococcus faecium 13.SD.W.09]